MVLWKVNFSSTRNRAEGLTLPVVPLRLFQFNLVRTLLAHQSVNSTFPPNSFRMSGLFALIIPLAMFKICLLLMTPPACRVPIAMSLTFRIRWSPKIFDLSTFFRTTSPSHSPPLNLFFQLITDVLVKLCLTEEVPSIDACFPYSHFLEFASNTV